MYVARGYLQGTDNPSSCQREYGDAYRWEYVSQYTCPTGTVENSTQTGCEAPTNPCTELQGQELPHIWLAVPKGTAKTYQQIERNGCVVQITAGGNICALTDDVEMIACYFVGEYTGAQPTSASENTASAEETPPPSNPENPIVVPGDTETPAPDQVLEKGDQILQYQSDGLTYTITETLEGDKLTTTTTKTNQSGQVVQTIRLVETVTAPTIINNYTVDATSSGGTGVTVSQGQTSQTGGGSSSTTTSTTSYPDGSENSTCEGDDCAGDGDGDGIPDNEGGTEYTQANCNTVPWCKGDVIQCAQAREAWRTMCEVRKQAESIFGTEQERTEAQNQLNNEAQAVDTVQEMEDVVGTTEINVGDLADFNTQLIPSGSAACPGDIIIPVWGTSFSVSFAPLCGLADSVRPLLLLFAYISAAVILYRALGNR